MSNENDMMKVEIIDKKLEERIRFHESVLDKLRNLKALSSFIIESNKLCDVTYEDALICVRTFNKLMDNLDDKLRS